MRTATLPAVHLSVGLGDMSQPQPAATEETQPADAADINTDTNSPQVQPQVVQQKTPLWLYLSNLLTLIVAAFFALRFWQNKRQLAAIYATESDEKNAQNQTENEAWNNFKRKLADKELPELRKALITWGQAYWKNASITSLQAIAAQAQEIALTEELRKLDEAIFSTHAAAPDTDTLLQLLANLRRNKQKKTAANGELQPLYKV